MFERGMDALSILKRIEKRTADGLDIEQIKKWLFPGTQAEIVRAYFILRCNMEKTREFIAKDFREGLAEDLVKNRKEKSDEQ